jgi:hypothetical protein
MRGCGSAGLEGASVTFSKTYQLKLQQWRRIDVTKGR